MIRVEVYQADDGTLTTDLGIAVARNIHHHLPKATGRGTDKVLTIVQSTIVVENAKLIHHQLTEYLASVSEDK